MRAQVIDPDGRPVAAGTIGRLAVRGPTRCRYLADERQRNYVRDGWNITGDTYVMDEDGYLVPGAIGRHDRVLRLQHRRSGGEAALLTHPAVGECGVVGAPDDGRGKIVKAYVVLSEGYAPGPDLTEAAPGAREGGDRPLAGHPRAIEYVDALPRTQTGKLQRFELRRIAEEAGTRCGKSARG